MYCPMSTEHKADPTSRCRIFYLTSYAMSRVPVHNSPLSLIQAKATTSAVLCNDITLLCVVSLKSTLCEQDLLIYMIFLNTNYTGSLKMFFWDFETKKNIIYVVKYLFLYIQHAENWFCMACFWICKIVLMASRSNAQCTYHFLKFGNFIATFIWVVCKN